jgi:hypothetical protein
MWKIQIGLDPDTTGEITLTGIWEENGETFSFTERGSQTVEGQDVFIAHAILARNAWKQKATDDKKSSDTLLAKLNTADPEVI